MNIIKIDDINYIFELDEEEWAIFYLLQLGVTTEQIDGIMAVNFLEWLLTQPYWMDEIVEAVGTSLASVTNKINSGINNIEPEWIIKIVKI